MRPILKTFVIDLNRGMISCCKVMMNFTSSLAVSHTSLLCHLSHLRTPQELHQLKARAATKKWLVTPPVEIHFISAFYIENTVQELDRSGKIIRYAPKSDGLRWKKGKPLRLFHIQKAGLYVTETL